MPGALAQDRPLRSSAEAERPGGVHGGPEAIGAGSVEELVDAVPAHPDHARGDGDAAGFGQSLDEGALARGRPAAVARDLAGHGGEIGQCLQGHGLVDCRPDGHRVASFL